MRVLNEYECWTIFGIGFFLMILILCSRGCENTHKETMRFIDKGYHQEQRIGADGLMWKKP